jgi:hypothetical protein
MALEGSLQNRLMENMVGRPEPRVGEGATILLYTDRKPVTIVGVFGDLVITQRDEVTADPNRKFMGHQDWLIKRDPTGTIEAWKRTKDGRFTPYGEKVSKHSTVLATGVHEAYHDWSF